MNCVLATTMPGDREDTEGESDTKNRSEGVTRRETLRSVGAGSIIAFAGFTNTSGPTVTIPEIKRGNEVISYSEVPKKWLTHVNKVEKVRSIIHENHKEQPWYDYISQGRGKTKTKGLFNTN